MAMNAGELNALILSGKCPLLLHVLPEEIHAANSIPGRFFKHLGKHLVNDLVHLHLKIHADAVSIG